MGNLYKKVKERKLEIAEKLSIELKEKSTPKKNYYTSNNFLNLINERLKLEGLTTISPTSIKGNTPAKYLQKYAEEIKKFKKEVKTIKHNYNEHLYIRIEELEEQVENLLLDLVTYKDSSMELEKNYEKLMENYNYQKLKKNEVLKKYEELKKTCDEN